MSEIERLRFDVRELTLSRDGWRERCEELERKNLALKGEILMLEGGVDALEMQRDQVWEMLHAREKGLAKLRAKVQGWGCRVKEMQERQNFSFDVDTCDELAEEMREEAGK